MGTYPYYATVNDFTIFRNICNLFNPIRIGPDLPNL